MPDCWSSRCASWSCCERLLGLRAAVLVAGRGLPHLVGRVLQPPRRVREILPLLALLLELPPQLLELPRGLLRLVGQLPLRRPAAARVAAAALRALALLLGLRQLPARQLAEPLGEIVDLLIRVLLLRALRRLVLIRLAIELELEQVRQLRRHLAAAAAAAPAAALAHDHVVELLGVLQVLERALLRRHRFLRLEAAQQVLGGLHFLGGLRQDLGDLAEVRRRCPAAAASAGRARSPARAAWTATG